MKSGKIIIILGISASGKTYYKNYLTQKYGFYQFKIIVQILRLVKNILKK